MIVTRGLGSNTLITRGYAGLLADVWHEVVSFALSFARSISVKLER